MNEEASSSEKVLIIFPSFLTSGWGAEWKPNPSVSAPLGPLYIATAIQRKGYQVKFIDLNVEDYTFDAFSREVLQSNVAGISVYSRNYEMSLRLISDVRTVKPDIKIVCGGPHPSFTKKPIPGADVTVVGEAEEFVGDLVTKLLRSEDLRRFPGLIFELDGKFIDTGNYRIVTDLDSSPFPDRALFDSEKYNDWVGLSVGKRIYYISGSRGCPNSCTFCTDPFNVYRQRSPANVMSELEMLRMYRPEIVVFVDDFFLAGKKGARKLLDLMADAQLPMKFVLETRVDSLDEETVKACKRAGVSLIQVGIESGNQQVIDYYGKGFSLSQVRSAAELLHQHGIYSMGFLIIGAPMEREPQIHDTLKFVTSIPLDFIAVSPLAYRYPSPLWKELVKNGVIAEDEMETLADERTGSYPRHELKKIIKQVYVRFYFRPGHLLRIITKTFKSRNLFIFRLFANFLYLLVANFRIFSYGVLEQKEKGSSCEQP